MKIEKRASGARNTILLAGMMLALGLTTSVAHAQVSTATVKGQVTAAGAPAKAGAEVVATNTATGFSYRTTTREDGSYVLTGLAPGSYVITVGAGKPTEVITLAVGQSAALDLSTGAETAETTLEQVTVVGSALRKDVRMPDVGTSISTVQMENLPQVTRNFLSFADLAPGVRFNVDPNSGQVQVQGGAQNRDNINVFIDGVSQKNYILRGGLAGMDSTRGNPFPQSAVGEYKVISQNYKAEYDQVSSTAITAVTRSGTNELHADMFWDRTTDDWRAYSPFESKAESQGVKRPPFDQDQYGFSIGGPIIKDKLHYFIAYEGKNISEPRQVVLQNDNLLPDAGIVPSLRALQGSQTTDFKEDLVLAKLNAQLNEEQRIELTARFRRESDLVPEDRVLSIAENSKDRSNDETRFDFKYEWARDVWLHEARLGYQDTVWNPHSRSSDPWVQYFVSPSNETNNTRPVLFVGGSPDAQNRGQKGTLLQYDVTYTGYAGHTLKGGAKLNMMTFDLSGTAFSVPRIKMLIDNVTGIPTPFEVTNAIPAVTVNYDDNQVGLYFQDDWEVNDRLEINLGLRWDYETNMLNDDYVTPADRVAIFYAQDPRDGAPVGQTYGQSLALGGITIEDYIATGSSRKDYKGAFQPRLGFSYDLSGGTRETVLFGGLGRAYDRTMANHALDELQKNQQPNGEIWLIKNDHDMPYTDQFALGVRQAFGAWNTELGYMDSRSHNQFNWFGGNRDPQGGWGNQSPIDPLWGSVPPYGTLILGDFITEAKTRAGYLKAEKPYTTESGWGLSATYTLSDGSTTNRQWNNDIFNWTYGKPGMGWNPSVEVERHRLVMAGLTDKLIPWGVMLSGKMTLGSGLPYQVTSCAAGWNQCVYEKGDGNSFKQIDVALSKEFAIASVKVQLRADVINLFNWVNYGGYDGWGGGPGNPQNQYGGDNPNVGVPNSIGGPMRTFKLALRASF